MQTTQMTAPAKLNGHPVIKSTVHTNCVTVMVAKTGVWSEPLKIDEFVVATWWPELKSGWSWGHYFPTHFTTEVETRALADADFAETEKRNAER